MSVRSETVSSAFAAVCLFAVGVAKLGHPVLGGGLAALALAVAAVLFALPDPEVVIHD